MSGALDATNIFDKNPLKLLPKNVPRNVIFCVQPFFLRESCSVGAVPAYKWIRAALCVNGSVEADLLLESLEPNDRLCSQVHSTIAGWHLAHTTARDAGVVDHRPSELDKTPPQCILAKTRGWLLRYINQKRAERDIPMLADDKWGRRLAGVKADARAVNKEVNKQKAESGTLYQTRSRTDA